MFDAAGESFESWAPACPGGKCCRVLITLAPVRNKMENSLGFTPVIVQALAGLILALVLGAAIGFERQIH